ncbi:response regulator [Duganella sp. FT94W]|uniref:Response regulator n=2 Tax=Duganella lactea TaxID=2692173 RepID=A0ABW9V858_9BURK|nr:response regulator [Duganella lactea]
MIADDHPLMRNGIAAVLSNSPCITVMAEAGDGDAAVALYRQHRPAITLMDLQMPGLGGIEAIRAIRDINPQARIIILTTFNGDAQIYRGLQAGASGYLLKNMARTELRDYVLSVHRGDSRLPADVSSNLPAVLTTEQLTRREVDVLKLVATGHTNQRAAGKLGLKEDTIKSYMKSILAKLRARDRTHAVTIALKRGFWES